MIRHDAFETDMPIEHLAVASVEWQGNQRKVIVLDDFGNYAEFVLDNNSDLSSKLHEMERSVRACSHAQTKIMTKVASNGRHMVCHQCQNCGDQVGSYLKKEVWPEDRPHWDDSIAERMRKRILKAQEPIYLEHIQEAQEQEVRYANYLLSPEWREKRRMVLERDKWTCCGCGKAKATQVHHLTYRDIFNEFLFQLVSICDECHDRYHEGGRTY